MNPTLSSEANALLDLYHTACLCDNYDRAKVSKLITAYNKKNPTQKLKTYHIIKRNFPTFFQYMLSVSQVKEEELFENKFTKIFYNLHILPSAEVRQGYRGMVTSYQSMARYSGRRSHHFEDAYKNKNILFKDIVSGKVYTLKNDLFISVDNPSFTVSLLNLNSLSLFVEV